MPKKTKQKSKASWYRTGADGWAEHKREQKRLDAQKSRKRRFWLPRGGETKITFLDHPDFWVYEHRLKIGNSWQNYFSCRKQLVDGSGVQAHCPLCTEGDNHPSHMLIATIIDHSSYVRKSDGEEVSNFRSLIAFPPSSISMIKRRIERAPGNDLAYCTFNVARGESQKEVGIGADWEYLGQVDPDDLAQLMPKGFEGGKRAFLAPVDYATEFEPQSEAELYAVLGIDPPGGASDVDDEDTSTKLPWADETDESEEDEEESREEPEEEPTESTAKQILDSQPSAKQILDSQPSAKQILDKKTKPKTKPSDISDLL